MSMGSSGQGLRAGPVWAQAEAFAGLPASTLRPNVRRDSLRRFSPVVSYLSCSHSGGGG